MSIHHAIDWPKFLYNYSIRPPFGTVRACAVLRCCMKMAWRIYNLHCHPSWRYRLITGCKCNLTRSKCNFPFVGELLQLQRNHFFYLYAKVRVQLLAAESARSFVAQIILSVATPIFLNRCKCDSVFQLHNAHKHCRTHIQLRTHAIGKTPSYSMYAPVQHLRK